MTTLRLYKSTSNNSVFHHVYSTLRSHDIEFRAPKTASNLALARHNDGFAGAASYIISYKAVAYRASPLSCPKMAIEHQKVLYLWITRT